MEEADDPIDQIGTSDTAITGTPDIVYSGADLDVQAMVDGIKKFSDFAYTVDADTHTGSQTPGPGDGWGTPTPGVDLEHASSCSEYNIVHYDTDDTHIRLSGGVSGCGILLIEGDAIIHGNFDWYGPIIVTGSITYSGGGTKQISGAVLSGGSVDADVVGGNTNVVFCSAAVNTSQFLPLRVLSWREL